LTTIGFNAKQISTMKRPIQNSQGLRVLVPQVAVPAGLLGLARRGGHAVFAKIASL